MNVFFRIGDKLITAPTDDRILNGVTRKSLIQLAQDRGIEVEVRKVEVKEVVEAARNGELKEVFGSGTAAVVVPITGIGYKDEHFDLPKLETSYALSLKESLLDIQYNIAEDPYNWTRKI